MTPGSSPLDMNEATVVRARQSCETCGSPHLAGQPCPAPGGAPDPSALQDPLLGLSVGNFRLMRRLGQGGMGSVYLAIHAVIGSRVAVKLLHEHLASDPGLVARFYTEARAVNLIRHENIVSIFDISALPPNRPYLIMEYLEGHTLGSFVGRPTDTAMAIPILTQICNGLQAAHAHVVHRDLKPDNIFLVRQGTHEHFVKITDFGIAKLQSGVGGGTVAGMVMGTPEYMAPEQFVGMAVDHRADLYALGVIAYQLATGQPPFSGDSLMAFHAAHCEKAPVPPRELVPGVPVALERAILKALAKRPEDRFQSAGEFRAALEEVTAGLERPAAAPRTATSAPVAARRPTPKPTHSAPFAVRLSWEGEAVPRSLSAIDLSHGGLYVCNEGEAPPLQSLVRIDVPQGSSELSCRGEVVRHVRVDQARAWDMPPGFAVQFLDVSAGFRKSIDRLLRGQSVDQQTPPPTRHDPDAQAVEAVLAKHERHLSSDPYALLGLERDAPCGEVHRRARATMQELEALRAKALTPPQRSRLERLLSRMGTTVSVISNPVARAAHDASQGNYRGVARCLSAGLSVTRLESLRQDFLSREPGARDAGMAHAAIARAMVAAGDTGKALGEYEKALSRDPLNLELQRSYWQLKGAGSREPRPQEDKRHGSGHAP